jgi:dTDP-4-dehydrorhamnose reductase
MTLRNLVVGASGFIGNILHQKLEATSVGTFYSHPAHGLTHLDIQDREQVSSCVNAIKPAVIYHPAATPNVDWCEDNPDACNAVNVSGTRNLALAAKKASAKLVFFSTDYVFDGLKGPYSETDKPNPINVYGQAKWAAEQIVAAESANSLIIRITVVYGWEARGKNFVMSLIERLKHGSTVKVPIDQTGSPTFADNMLETVLELVRREAIGTFHVCGERLLDRYAFARLVATTFSLDQSLLIPVSTSELGQRARRPLQAGMRIEKVQSLVSKPLLAPEEGLLIMKDQYIHRRPEEH